MLSDPKKRDIYDQGGEQATRKEARGQPQLLFSHGHL